MRISDWSSDVCSSDLDAVDTRRRAAVRRRAELERVDNAAEIRIDVGLAVTRDLECLVHDIRAVVPDRTRRQFDAVADDVILPSENVERNLGLECFELALRQRAGGVGEIDLDGF